MNIWNKVFLGIIFVTAIAVAVLTAVEMKIRSTGQQKIDALEKKIGETKAQIDKIADGAAPMKASADKKPSELSFEEIRSQTVRQFYERGRAWFGCLLDGKAVQRVVPPKDSEQGQDIKEFIVVEVPIIVTEPRSQTKDDNGNDIDEAVMPETLKGIVYVFEESSPNNKGTFLGRFRVSENKLPEKAKFMDAGGQEKNAYKAELVTIDPLSAAEIEHIEAAAGRARKDNAPDSRSSWAVYLTPPVDRVAGIIDRLTEEEKQAIPEELRERFQPRPVPALTDEEKNQLWERAKHDKPDLFTDGNKQEAFVLLQKYHQTMDDFEQGQDFSLALDWLFQQRSRLNRDKATALSDMETFKSAKEKADAENKKLEGDCVLEEKRVDAMVMNRDAVKDLKEEYEKEINKLTLQIEKLRALQAALVAKIAECQMKAVEKIEEKTKREAVSAASQNQE
jgi:hypothetical protein